MINILRENNKILFFILFLIIYLLGWFIQARILLNWDVSAIIHEAEGLLAGGTYVTDYFETNPPLIIYLSLPPIFLAHLTSISIPIALRIYVFSLSFISLALCYLLLKNLFKKEHSQFKNIFFLTISFIFCILPLYEFGQREHLLVIFSLPYILALVLRLQKNKLSHIQAMIIGLFAGMAFSLKPFFVLIPLMLAAYDLSKNKLSDLMRTELFFMLGFMIFYLIFSYYMHEDYFNVVIPYAKRLYYSGISASWYDLIFSPMVIFCGLIVIFHLSQIGEIFYRDLRCVLLITLIGTLIVYFLGRTPWYYHILPAVCLMILNIMLLVGLIFLQYKNMTRNHHVFLWIFFFTVILFIHYFLGSIWTILVFQPKEFYIYFAILFTILFYLASQNGIQAFGATFLIITLSAIFSYLISVDEWNKHQFILTLTMLMVLFYLCLSPYSKVKSQYVLMALFSMVIFAYPAYFIANLYQKALGFKISGDRFVNFMYDHARQQPVYLISTRSIYPFAEYAGAYSVSRFPMLWMIPGLAKKQNCVEPQCLQDKNFLIAMITEDLQIKKPKFVFIDASLQKKHPENIPVDYLTYFSENESFRKAWKFYHYQTMIIINSNILFATAPQVIKVYERNS